MALSGAEERIFPAVRENGLRSPSLADRSNVHPPHASFWACAGGGADRDRGRNTVDIGRGQLHTCRAQILLELGNPLGAGDRNHVRALRQQPGQAKLSRGAVFLLGDRLDPLDEGTVLGEVVADEAGVAAADVARVDMGGRARASVALRQAADWRGK
jgi:hypothetical protein